MKVTPLDLRQQRFRAAFRGFDRAEVTALLHEVAEEYEAALLEVDRQRQELARMEERINEYRQHETNLKSTLMTAQKLAEDIRTNAETQAANIVREAEGRSALMLQKSQARLEDVQREIDGLRLKRRDVEVSLESTIASLRNAIDFVHEQDQRDRDDKILLHRPRQPEGAPAPAPVVPPKPARSLEQLLEVGAKS